MSGAFVVTPMSQDFNLEPGETYTGTITVANPSEALEDFAYQVTAAPYSVIGEEYDADLTTISNRSMMVDWIEIDNPRGVLKPNETASIDFKIIVPGDAPAGGQYASILVTEDLDAVANQGVEVSSVFEIASLIYANVAGETMYGGEILENNIPGFVMSTPVAVNALISNTGNTHQTATTVLEVKNLITGEVILPTEQNAGRYAETIMPETTRRTEYNIVNLPVVGVVQVSQTIYYNGISSVEVKDVLICPIWFIATVLAILGGIICGIIFGVKRHCYKKSIKVAV